SPARSPAATTTAVVSDSDSEEADLSAAAASPLPPAVVPHRPVPPPRRVVSAGVGCRPLMTKPAQFRAILDAPIADMSALRRLAWNGVPEEVRGEVWRLLSRIVPERIERRVAALRRRRDEYAASAKRLIIDGDNSIASSRALENVTGQFK